MQESISIRCVPPTCRLYVVVLRATCPLPPPFFIQLQHAVAMWSHKLSQPAKPITVCHFGPCKWQPPWLPFASVLVTNWCLPHMHVVSLYKRASSPSPWLTFWLNMTPVTSRSRTRHLTWTLARLSVYSPFTRWLLISLVTTSADPLASHSLVTEHEP